MARQETEYEVKWKGYPSSANSFEPISSIEGTVALINYQSSKRSKKGKNQDDEFEYDAQAQEDSDEEVSERSEGGSKCLRSLFAPRGSPVN